MKNQLVQMYGEIKNELFSPPKGTQINNKPVTGGFWTSTLLEGNQSGWTKFAISEELISEEALSKMNKYEITICDTAKVLVIDSKEDYIYALENFGFQPNDISLGFGVYNNKKVLDFKLLSESYDAIQLTDKGRRDNYYEFYGWDCESTVWFNLDKFKKIKKI